MAVFYAMTHALNNDYDLYNMQCNDNASFHNRTLRSQRTIRINNNAIRLDMNLVGQSGY